MLFIRLLFNFKFCLGTQLTMNNKSHLALLLLIGALIAATSFAAGPAQVNGTYPQASSSTWEYAQLTLVGQDQVIWSPSGTNIIPQTRTLRDQYGRLGGNQRATFVNLLGQIGADRWELVTVVESTWTFKRSR